ncbi:MAG: tol-pal system protein YbgF [Alphaproteobacteria bacterium]
MLFEKAKNLTTNLGAKLKSFAFFVLLTVCAPVLSTAASGQYSQVDQLTLQMNQLRGDFDYVVRTLQNIQGELVVMQKQAGLGSGSTNGFGGGNTSGLAGLEVKVSGLEAQLRNLTGEIERIDFNIRQSNKDRKQFESQLLTRMRELEEQVATIGVPNPELLLNPAQPPQTDDGEGKVGIELSGFPLTNTDADSALQTAFDPYQTGDAVQQPDQQSTSDTTENLDAQGLYESALTNLQVGKYDESQKQFEAFLASYNQSVLASNASYWLGETFYSRGDYQRAALQFSDGFMSYRDGNKSADHLLKLGLSLSRLGRNNEACASYGLLKRRFANDRPGLVDRGMVEAQQLNCALQ